MPLIKARNDAKETTLLAQFRARVKLDRHALDLAAEEQPQLFMDVADAHVFAVSRHDAARDELLRVDAKLGRQTRADMEKEGTKPTEGKIADVVLGHAEHLTAADKMAKAKIEADEWSALRSALEHRKSMIRELATLYAAGYYTAGAAGGASRKVGEKNYQVSRERLTEARRSR